VPHFNQQSPHKEYTHCNQKKKQFRDEEEENKAKQFVSSFLSFAMFTYTKLFFILHRENSIKIKTK
jgi:hypothetical protein